MQEQLFFICPTDYLEPIIDNTFKRKNHYFTSLGNSMVFDNAMLDQLDVLLRARDIGRIYFVLSYDNSIVSDALGNEMLSDIIGLNDFYFQIANQKEKADNLWQAHDSRFLMLSYHLNNKIRELSAVLKRLSVDPVKIKGKIYHKEEAMFRNIYSDLVCRDYVYVN